MILMKAKLTFFVKKHKTNFEKPNNQKQKNGKLNIFRALPILNENQLCFSYEVSFISALWMVSSASWKILHLN